MVEALPPQFRAKSIPPVFPRFLPRMEISLPPTLPRTNREGSAGAKIVFSFTIPGESLHFERRGI